jgi:alcohol dehydrogenase
LVYHGPDDIRWEDKPMPVMEAVTDVIVRISKTTVCGTDLTILKGGVSTVSPGRILGHEATGYVSAVGPAVTSYQVGDHVLVPCTTSCGRCPACRRGLLSSCEQGGWLLGNVIDGVQAEYARVPLADSSLHRLPAWVDEEAALMLADIIPTGLEVGVQKGEVSLGDTVVIIGAGPVGLATLLVTQFYGPADIIVVDLDEHRLAMASRLGATAIINNRDGRAEEQIMALTGGQGVDVVIEVVGHPSTCALAQAIVGAGGRIANVGVHSQSVELHNDILWTRNITIRMGVVNTHTIPVLLRMIKAGKLDPGVLITHRMPLSQAVAAYDIFKRAPQERAIKIVLSAAAAPGPEPVEDAALIRSIVAQVLAEL